MSVHRLVDSVVKGFPDEVMQPGGAHAADIHARPLANRLEALEDRDVFRRVVGRCHVYNVRLVNRRPLFALCTTIVAVFHLHSAAAATLSEDVPLPGGTARFAQMLGIDPVPERARFAYEIARLVHNTAEGRKPGAEAFLLAMRQRGGRDQRLVPADPRITDLVPIPLSTTVWSDAIFRRRIEPRDLLATIIADRSAALMLVGLAALDDRTLTYFADHPSLLERIYEHSATAFGAFSSSLRIDNNRVVPPGAPHAAADHDDVTPLWEAVLLEKTTRADRFITQLL